MPLLPFFLPVPELLEGTAVTYCYRRISCLLAFVGCVYTWFCHDVGHMVVVVDTGRIF